MLRKQNKKGFTLAELLIVVAIIAVLTAIAVPLFVGALNKAETSVKNANIRAVRGAAVVYILGATSDNKDVYEQGEGKKGTMKEKMIVQATVTATGEVQDMKFVATGDEGAVKDDKGNYTVTVCITSDDIKIAASAGAGA